MRKIDKIIIHCSDSDAMSHNEVSVIRQWHLARGFKDVGYHYFIKKDGTIQGGRHLDNDAIMEPSEVGAHAQGENFDSIAICLHGKTTFSVVQFRALASLIKVCRDVHKIDKKKIYPHNHFNKKKTCPNFDVTRFIKTYLQDGSGYNQFYNKAKRVITKQLGKNNDTKPMPDRSKTRSGSRVEPTAKRKPRAASAKTRKIGGASKGVSKPQKNR